MSQHNVIRTKVLERIVAAGEDGMTDFELSQHFNKNKNSMPCRRREVELNGYCRKTGRYRVTDTGYAAIVHVATPEGIAFMQTGNFVPGRPRDGGTRIGKLEQIRDNRIVDVCTVKLTRKSNLLRIDMKGFVIPFTVREGDSLVIAA